MQYRVLDPNLTAFSQGNFCAQVRDGQIELPEALARELLAIGLIAPLPQQPTAEKSDDRLHQPGKRQTGARK